ncbi:MAG TPA: DUF4320 family protein [Clostridiaceae bacterium]|nr:DUF4320 family protein [Clostridiaceae bacterium]
MPSKVVVSGVMLVVLTVFIVFLVEFFVPVSMKHDMNAYCRSAIMKMEVEGSLTAEVKAELIDKMSNRGFKNITVTGSGYAKYGEEMYLRVEADVELNRLVNLFNRNPVVQRMVYDKTFIARKVVN